VRRQLRNWLVVVLIAVVGIFAVYVAVERYDQEQPNYTKIEDSLFLGGHVAAPPPGTSAVLNLCETADPYQVTVHRWAPIPDAEPAPTFDWLRAQVEFIESQRQSGRIVFVHCRNGVSRSAMVTTAYLMWREGWSRDEALAHVRSKRPEILPNPAFMRLLLEWEESIKCKGKTANRLWNDGCASS
jgi:hypothetical protein